MSMKTTVDISRPLLERARRAAAFRLRDASFRGEGLQPGVALGSWDAIRDAIHEGRDL